MNVEGSEFKNRLNTILSLVGGKLLLLSNDIGEGRFVKVRLEQAENRTDEEKQREKDHCLIQILNLIDKITIQCESSLKSNNYNSEYDEIAQQCQALLAYPHAWVRLRAAKILSQILLSVDYAELDVIVKNKVESERGFIYENTEDVLRSLVLDLCAQYTAGVSQEMAEQVGSFNVVNFYYCNC